MTEYFDVIDKNDKVIGKASRDECHAKGLLHRAVHIVIINSKGQLLLQKRSIKKDLYPGWWIDAAAGHVDSGETPIEAANREIMEEIGVSVNLEELFRFRKKWKGSGKIDNEIITVYAGRSDGTFKINTEEVQFVKFFSYKKIREMLKKEKFTPGTVGLFRELKKRPELLKRFRLS